MQRGIGLALRESRVDIARDERDRSEADIGGGETQFAGMAEKRIAIA